MKIDDACVAYLVNTIVPFPSSPLMLWGEKKNKSEINGCFFSYYAKVKKTLTVPMLCWGSAAALGQVTLCAGGKTCWQAPSNLRQPRPVACQHLRQGLWKVKLVRTRNKRKMRFVIFSCHPVIMLLFLWFAVGM